MKLKLATVVFFLLILAAVFWLGCLIAPLPPEHPTAHLFQ